MKIYEPNYTQVPNTVISLMPELKESELKVLLAIVRKTIGWQKSRDRISLTQLQELTGLGRASVAEAIHSEKLKGVVKVHKTDKGNEFELIIHSMNSEPVEGEVVQNPNHPSSEFEPVASMNSEHTKETFTKETIQKGDKPSQKPNSLEDVKKFFRNNDMKPEQAESFYYHYDAQGWVRQNGMAATSWQSLAMLWIRKERHNPPEWGKKEESTFDPKKAKAIRGAFLGT